MTPTAQAIMGERGADSGRCGLRTAHLLRSWGSTTWTVLNRRRAESGQVAVMLVILLPVLLGLAGLVVDGGIMFVHYRLGQAIVDDAAYAAATALDEETLSGITNEVTLDPAEACSLASENAAENSARNGGVLGSVSCSVSGTNVTVSGQVTSPTIFMRIFGINQVAFDLTSSAELKYGITEEGQ